MVRFVPSVFVQGRGGRRLCAWYNQRLKHLRMSTPGLTRRRIFNWLIYKMEIENDAHRYQKTGHAMQIKSDRSDTVDAIRNPPFRIYVNRRGSVSCAESPHVGT